jgi:hypothetical protein
MNEDAIISAVDNGQVQGINRVGNPTRAAQSVDLRDIWPWGSSESDSSDDEEVSIHEDVDLHSNDDPTMDIHTQSVSDGISSESELDNDDENETILSECESEGDSDNSRGLHARGRGGRGRNRGQGIVGRSQHSRGRGRGVLGGRARGNRYRRGRGTRRGSSSRVDFQELIPTSANAISEIDSDFQEPEEFAPVNSPGPQLDSNDDQTGFDLFRLFINDDVLDRLVESTLAYAEAKKNEKRLMYIRLQKSPLTKEEMARYIGALLLLSITSTKSYRQAWNPKKNQVVLHTHGGTVCIVFIVMLLPHLPHTVPCTLD